MTTKEKHLQRDAIRILQAQTDFAFYCEYVHERPLFAHQRRWAEELEKESARTLIVAPPGSLKSTLITYFIEWSVGKDPDFTCLYLMNTAEQARSKVASVSDTIEFNKKYHSVFPKVLPDKPRGWSHDRLFVKRENNNNPDATVYGTGFDGPYQGVHIHKIFIDDPTDQQDVYSEATMSQQRDRVKGVILDRLLPGGGIIAILTRWGINDLTKDLQDIGLRMIENPARGDYPWGDLLCPELFSYEDLEDLESVKGSGLYAMTYLCNPTFLAAQVLYFDAEKLQFIMTNHVMEHYREVQNYRLWKPPVVGSHYVLGADTAWGKTGSYNAATVFDAKTWEQVAELHGRLPPNDMANEIVALHKHFNHAYMGIERAGEGQERDGDSVVVVNKVVALLKDCSCKNRLFYNDWRTADPKKPGWVTDSKTRDFMLGEFAEAVRNLQMIIRSKGGVSEMMSFVRNNNGRPEANTGAHDDRVVCYAIVWQMRHHARFIEAPKEPAYAPASW